MLGCKNRVATTYSNNPTFGLQVGSTTPAVISGVTGYLIQSPTPPTARVLNNTPCTFETSRTNGTIKAVWDVVFTIPGNSVCDFQITLTNSQIYANGAAVSYVFNGIDTGFQTPLVLGTGFVPQGYYLGLYPMFHHEYMYTVGLVYKNLTTNYDKNVALVNSTCLFSSQTLNLTLPSSHLGAMQNANDTAGLTPFKMQLTCDPNANAYNVQTTINYTPASGVAKAVANADKIANEPNAASNVHIQVLDANRNPLASGDSVTSSVPASGSTITNSFFARYISAGSPVAGTVRGVVTVSLSYP